MLADVSSSPLFWPVGFLSQRHKTLKRGADLESGGNDHHDLSRGCSSFKIQCHDSMASVSEIDPMGAGNISFLLARMAESTHLYIQAIALV